MKIVREICVHVREKVRELFFQIFGGNPYQGPMIWNIFWEFMNKNEKHYFEILDILTFWAILRRKYDLHITWW